MTYLNALKRKHFLLYDTTISFLLSWILTLDLKFWNLFIIDTKKLSVLFQILLQVHTSLLGFLIAVMAIIFSFKDGQKIEYFQKSNQYPKVMDIYISALSWLMILSIGDYYMIIGKCPSNDSLIMFWLVLSAIVPWIKINRCVWIAREMFLLSITDEQK